MMSGDDRPKPRDPIAAASGRGETQFPKRFYREVGVIEVDDGYAVTLDGHRARTPARHPLVLPSARTAELVADEWSAVRDEIDPREMRATRLANSIIDGVRVRQADVLAEILRYAESDMILYRADDPPALVRAQQAAWDPLVAWSRDTLQVPLNTAMGVVFVEQPKASMARLAETIRVVLGEAAVAPARLGTLHVMTTLTGSAILALAVALGRLSPEDAWASAHVDEDFQRAEWGEDAEAAERRAARWKEMRTAAAFCQACLD